MEVCVLRWLYMNKQQPAYYPDPVLSLARLFADVLNDSAMFMEILAPYFPAFFTLIVCTAGILKVKKNQVKCVGRG